MTKRTSKSAGHSKKSSKGNTGGSTSNAKSAEGSMKMTMYTAPTMVPRSQAKERRQTKAPGGKRLALARNFTGKARAMARRSLDPCDNSNDSGLGFDHHMDPHTIALTDRLNWTDERAQAKRPKFDIKLENDEVNDNYSFPEHAYTYRDNTMLIRTTPSASHSSLNVSNGQSAVSNGIAPRCVPHLNRTPPPSPVTLISQLQARSRYMDISLSIICQPEQQHRARYQTEGSRGAVKDRSGNGFPVVQLSGYNKPTTLQVFIGTDVGKVTPHMFYQACRVSGKNSTPCNEKKIDGTIVIELQLDPGKDMVGTCDCVGILKERNVDVEHRFPDQLASRSKKKSTRCRMVFRTTVTHDDGTQETLQVCSQPIVCTQPPGIPEISKKSLTSCPASGGLELFIIGKNFLKDTLVYFQSEDDLRVRWEQSVVPDKEFLQQTHLVCVVPPYLHTDITEPVTVRLYVVSSGKTSEVHPFVYTPVNGAMPSVHVEQSQNQSTPFLSKILWTPVTKQEHDVGMMPPPGTSLVPLSQRRSSTTMISGEVHSPPMRTLKQELMDENSQNSILDPSELRQGRYRHISESSLDVHQGDSNLSMINDNSIDMIRHNQIVQSNINENSNLSIVNENSMDMLTRQNSQLCETDDSRCSTFSQSASNSLRSNDMTSIVMDLRMKMPMATVADLVNTNAPSMATLQSFGVTESTTLPLPAQSAQSVESYLTNIETKGENSQVIQVQTGSILSTTHSVSHISGNAAIASEATFISQPTSILSNTTPEVAKSEDQDSQVSQTLQTSILPAPITAEKLDALVNCALDSHITSPKNSDVMLSTRDVLLNTPLPPIINTPLTSPQINTSILTPAQVSPNIPPEVILNSQISPSLMCRTNTQDTLLPPNICQTSPNVDASLSSQLLSTTSPTAPLTLNVTEPEKAIILNAAADLLETQKKINDLQATLPEPTPSIINDILTTSNSVIPTLGQMPNTGNNFYTSATNGGSLDNNLIIPKTLTTDNKRNFVLPVPMKEMQADKKTEDRMIPSSFATMSENELINIINPSCFDQV